MSSRVRVPRWPLAFGGWTGRLTIADDVMTVTGDDGEHSLSLDATEVRRASFNSTNGLWTIRMKDRRKHYLQMSGAVLSADRSPEGRAATEQVKDLFTRHGVFFFSV